MIYSQRIDRGNILQAVDDLLSTFEFALGLRGISTVGADTPKFQGLHPYNEREVFRFRIMWATKQRRGISLQSRGWILHDKKVGGGCLLLSLVASPVMIRQLS